MAVTIHYLEMLAREALRPAPRQEALQHIECVQPQWQLNRFLYQFVGGPWQWTDKLGWSDAQWQAWVEDPGLRTWVGYVRGAIAGYFELQRQPGATVEIAYFGLTPTFIGQGLGGDLLTRSIAAAWEQGAHHVRVHTCSLDHPAALANYQARGFTLYRQETHA